ncbi:MAG TPA: hypothetical protein VFI25_10650 [Planctomycetota bacterium]|jgi:hypothetical protein|nr:hypothetical protein [Planctomycetota bacterium]
MRTTSLLSIAAAFALAPSLRAQRIWTVTGLPGVLEENAATGALLSAYPLPAPFVPFAAPAGDLSVDRATGTLWITDGLTVGQVARTGGPPLAAYPVPPPMGPLTGLAYDTTAGFPNLWMTDGFLIGNYGIGPFGLFPLAPPFPGPLPALTGLDYDSSTGTLWVVGAAGASANVTPFGAVLGFFPPPLGAFGPPFSGIAVDTSLPGGPLVARVWLLALGGIVNLLTGAVAEDYIFVGTTHEGIGWAPMPNRYGAGTAGPAGFLPEIDSIGGFATAGNATFSITISNAVPGPSFLMLSALPAAIPLAIFGLGPGDLLADPAALIAMIPAPAVGPGPGLAGQLSVLAIPPGPAFVGATFYAQWINFDGLGFGLSRGLSITIGEI